MVETDLNLVEDFRADLTAAVELKDDAFARNFDRDFVDGNGTIAYAVDVAILNKLFSARPVKHNSLEATYQLFCGPHSPAETRERLQTQQTRLKEALLWRLVDRLDEAGPRGPSSLLMLPGHSSELRNLFTRVVADLGRTQSEPQQLEAITDLVKTIYRRLRENAGIRTDEQEERLGRLNELLAEISDPHVRFRRLADLIKRSRIVGMGAAAKFSPFDQPAFAPGGSSIFISVAGSAVPSGGQDDPGSSSWWANKLHGQLPHVYLDADQKALSTLDRLNRTLDPEKARIILVTDNNLLIKAGKKYRPLKYGRSGVLAQLTFSDLYLRHPRSLVMDTASVSPLQPANQEERGSDVLSWLDALFAGSSGDAMNGIAPPKRNQAQPSSVGAEWLAFRKQKRRLRASISDHSRLSNALFANPDLHKTFAENWTRYVANVSDDYQADTVATSKLVSLAVARADVAPGQNPGQLIDDIRARIRRLKAESWGVFFNTAADTGLELTGLESMVEAVGFWPVPPLYVRGNPHIRGLLEAFWKPADIRADPAGMLRRLTEPVMQHTLQNSYVQAICYGLLFAVAGRWALAALLARRGVEIAQELTSGITGDRPNPTGVYVDGREANYLLAVSLRVTARGPAGLARARGALSAAKGSRVDPGEDDGEAHAPLSGLRFDTEDISIRVAEASSRTGIVENTLPVLAGLRREILVLIDRSGSCSNRHIQAQTCIALRSDYVVCLLASASADGSTGLESVRSDEELHLLIKAQLRDAAEVYGQMAYLPLRDRALLRLGAAFAGILDTLPGCLQDVTTDSSSPGQANAGQSEAFLTMIEATVERVSGTRASKMQAPTD